MTRTSKKAERRASCPRKRRPPSTIKTGAIKESTPFKEHPNALEGEIAAKSFIPKIK